MAAFRLNNESELFILHPLSHRISDTRPIKKKCLRCSQQRNCVGVFYWHFVGFVGETVPRHFSLRKYTISVEAIKRDAEQLRKRKEVLLNTLGTHKFDEIMLERKIRLAIDRWVNYWTEDKTNGKTYWLLSYLKTMPKIIQSER